MGRTPVQITSWIASKQSKMDQPAQWYGTEPNAFRKDWETSNVRVCLMAMWGYEQAAGNMAIPIVYSQINKHRDDFLCDRVYLPATPRDLNAFVSDGYPIFGIESKHELGDFDIVGTSISYPVLSINLVKLLRMSGIPPRRTDRVPEEHPMVLVGGQMYGAPEVLANIVDCVFAGEVEDEVDQPGIGAVLDRVKVFKAVGLWNTDRMDCYRRLAQEFNFLYFPALVDVFYGYEDRESVADQAKAMGQEEVYPSKQVIGYALNVMGVKGPFRKRHVKDLDGIEPMTAPPLLYIDPGAGAGDIETSRGCPAWCSFCALSFRQKPYRQRNPEYMQAYAAEVVKNTGVVHMAPFGPDFPMHTKKKALLKAILENVTDDIDASSMRVDDFLADSQYILLQAHAGMDTVTLGVEGNCLTGDTFIAVPGRGVLRLDEAECATQVLRRGVRAITTGAWSVGKRSTVKVVFSDGTAVRCTPDHLIRVRDGQPSSKRVYLTPEEREATGTTSNYLSKRAQVERLEECWREAGALNPGDLVTVRYGLSEWGQTSLSHDEAWLLGVLSGDGRLDAKGVEVRCPDEGVLTKAEKVLTALAADHGAKTATVRQRNGTLVVRLYSRAFVQYLRDVHGVTSKREVPAAVRAGSRSVVQAYLNGVLDADGCVPDRASQHGLELVLGTSSEAFARELHVLFQALGSPASVTTSGGTWSLRVRDDQGSLDWVDFAETTRAARLETARERIGARLGQVQWRSGQGGVKHVSVVSVTPCEDAEVFDLAVPQGESFDIAGGIEVHNSQRMRDFIGKGAGDDDIKKAFVKGVQAGINKFKFYMIAAMPGEDENDIARILQLAKDIADLRDAMGSRARIQFSWAPMLIEGNTPLQWFAPTTINLALSEAWDQFRDLGIDFRLGGKAKKDRLGYFQLTQRASREIGAAMLDAVIEMDSACWGGAPKGLYEKVEEALKARGFLNGYADAYDERTKHDMFGWEMIDQGINVELLWVTYAQMVEFLESTDSATYDEHFYADYHGSEWIARCDERCMGRTCGVCDKDDLKIRRGYIAGAAEEVDIDLTKIKVIDQTTIAQRVRMRIGKRADLRFVMNDHHRYAFRRACNIAELPLTKRSIKFASDLYKFKDWTHGTDYVDLALTKRLSQVELEEYVQSMDEVLLRDSSMYIEEWEFLPDKAPDVLHTMDLSMFAMEITESIPAVQKALDAWASRDYVLMVIKEIGHLGLIREEVNAKDFVEDIWLVRVGHKVALRMLLRGKATPYLVYAALFDKISWVAAADKPAMRVDVFQKVNDVAYDFFSKSCIDCGRQVPVPLVEVDTLPERCPKCHDIAGGYVVASMKEKVS